MKVPLGLHIICGQGIVYNPGIAEKIKLPRKPYRTIATRNAEKGTYKALDLMDQEVTLIDVPTEDPPIIDHRFINEMSISSPQFITSIGSDKEPRIMYIDIEVETTGTGGEIFNPGAHNVMMIGYAIDEGPIRIIDGCKDIIDGRTDINIIEEFEQVLKDTDPDIIVGYNSNQYDIPFLLHRYKLHFGEPRLFIRKSMEFITSYDKVGYVRNDLIDPVKRHVMNQPRKMTPLLTPGYVPYDLLWSSTMKDVSLGSLKNRKMKTVAKYYGYDPEEMDIQDLRNTLEFAKKHYDKFVEYLESDINVTRELSKIYLPKEMAIADLSNIPLSETLNIRESERGASISSIVMEREFRKNGYACLYPNKKRYQSIFITGAERATYQGASTGIYIFGKIPKVYKLDYQSMYPSTMITFGISPENIYIRKGNKRLRGEIWGYPYDKDAFKIVRSEDKTVVYVPDKKLGYTIPITIDHSRQPILPTLLERMIKERTKYKRLASKAEKEGDKREEQICKSFSDGLKILQNSVYGLQASSGSVVADYLCAVLVTGICRVLAEKLMDTIGREYIIELDSVTGDTPIYVRNEIGQVDIIPIEDLHHDKTQERNQYRGNLAVLSRNGWSPIVYTKRHSVAKRIYRTEISDGYVDCTEDHSLFDTDKNEIKPTDIETNDRIEVYNVVDTLTDPIYIEGSVIYENSYGSIQLTRNLAWLFGLIIAEGSYTSWYYAKRKSTKRNLSISMQDKNILTKAKHIIDNELGYYLRALKISAPLSTVKIYDTTKSSATHRLTGLTNVESERFFRKMLYTGNKKDKKVPICILNCSDRIMEAFIDGYMIGDGYKTITPANRKKECFDTIDKSVAAGIKFLWNKLGKLTRVNTRKDKLNITTVHVRFPNPRYGYQTIDKSKVKRSTQIHSDTNNTVYDISTADGTFVTALGDIILHNTDGCYMTIPFPASRVNDALTDLIINEWGMDRTDMKVDFEEFGRGYFHLKKNYVIEKVDKDGNTTGVIHKGSSIKGSTYSYVVDRAIDVLIGSVLFNNIDWEAATRQVRNIQNREMEDLTMTVKAKHIGDYNSTSGYRNKYLRNRHDKVYGTANDKEEKRIEYVFDRHSPYGVEIVELANMESIDYKKYMKKINDLIDIFAREEKKKRMML